MALRHLVSARQYLDKARQEQLFARARQLQRLSADQYPKPLASKLLANLFYEPSTRTRLSFEAAIKNLGGQTISLENGAVSSSATKGESLEDTIRVVSGYCQGIVLRHPEIGAARRAAHCASVPVINAGDGGGEHPTQALLDMYTIYTHCGHPDGLTIGIAGDLLHSRSMHSLIKLLATYKTRLVLIAPTKLHLHAKSLQSLSRQGSSIVVADSWQPWLPQLDVLYTNRIQQERFKRPADYEAVKNSFVLTTAEIQLLPERAIILNPLPRVNEILPEVDADPRALYFKQAHNGVFVRMALLEQYYA